MIILSRRRRSSRDDGGRPDELVAKHEDVLRARREATARLLLRRTDYVGGHASESRARQPHAGHVEREHDDASGAHARDMPEHCLAASSGSRRRARGTRQASRAAGHALAACHDTGREPRCMPRQSRSGCAPHCGPLAAQAARRGPRWPPPSAQGALPLGLATPQGWPRRLGWGWPPHAPRRLAVGPRARCAGWLSGRRADYVGWLMPGRTGCARAR
jgi:hypothetical protein